MRVGLLYFGLLNTFPRIYGPDGTMPNIAAALEALGMEFEVFLDTSPLAFLKVPASAPNIHPNELAAGFTFIDRVPATDTGDRDYLVLQHDPEDLRRMVLGAFPGREVHLSVTPPEAATWSGEGYLENMIRLFLRRKARLVENAVARAAAGARPFDLLIMARPDSALRPRGRKRRGLAEVVPLLAKDIEDLLDDPALGADFGAFHVEGSERRLRMFKNDLLIGSPEALRAATSLIDLVDAHAGDVYGVYPDGVFRCGACRKLTFGKPDRCTNCGADESFTDITTWPELITSQHVDALGLAVRPLRITGDSIRADAV